MVQTVEVVIKQQGQKDRTVRLPEGATRMGRAEDNEIVLSDVGVSRRHAQIYVSRGEVTVEDLGSGNGTYYNGYRVQSQPLRNSDEVVIDPFVLQFRISGADNAADQNNASTVARLDVIVGAGMAATTFPIQPAVGLSMGRSEDRDVVIPDPASSRHHCQIVVQGEEYILRDMGSANGVFVNAVRVRECTLQNGDLIRIGNTEMRFTRNDMPAAAQAPAAPAAGAGAAPMAPPAAPAAAQAAPPPQPPSSNKGLYAAAFVVLVGIVSVLTLAVLLLFGLVAYTYANKTIEGIEPSPVRTTLNLPDLPEQDPATVFAAGAKRLAEEKPKEALQDFYRVRLSDPGHAGVGLFLFAASETLVMDALVDTLQANAKAADKLSADRTFLLKKAKRGGRAGRNAEEALKKDFREDPIVIAEMGWARTIRMKEMEGKNERSEDHLKRDNYNDAILGTREVLQRTTIPDLRVKALQILAESEAGLAKKGRDVWVEAMKAEATGQTDVAKDAFTRLSKSQPANISAKIHSERL